MLQELFARAMDEMSYLYMGTQKTGKTVAAAIGSLEEYLEREGAGDPRKFFANPGVVPDMEMSDFVRRRTYNLMHFRFDSPLYTPFRANNIVRGRYYERHGEPDAPMVALLHGWRMESYMFFDRFARLLVKWGFNCAMPDLPYHMSRTPKSSFAGEHTFKDDAIHTMETMRQSLFDTMTVLNWAKERKKARMVGAMGVSFGALLSGMMACAEPMLDFAVLVAPPADPGRIFAASRLGRLIEKENPRVERLLRRYHEVMATMALTKLTPLVDPANIFIAEGLYDGMVPPEVVDELWEKWNRPKIVRYPQGHLSVILFNKELENDLEEWLRPFAQGLSANGIGGN
ncbi:MAG: hypothetical protein WCX65_07415 [bacterium]